MTVTFNISTAPAHVLRCLLKAMFLLCLPTACRDSLCPALCDFCICGAAVKTYMAEVLGSLLPHGLHVACAMQMDRSAGLCALCLTMHSWRVLGRSEVSCVALQAVC